MTDQDAFDEWFAKRDVWPRITYDEVWHAALAWLRSQGEPVAWMNQSESTIISAETKQRLIDNGEPWGESACAARTAERYVKPLFLAPQQEPIGEMSQDERGEWSLHWNRAVPYGAKLYLAPQPAIENDDREYLSAIAHLGSAMRRLVIAARTSGGTAGPDAELMAACAQAEDAMSVGAIGRAMEAPQPAIPDGWQPIETAPKDELILVGPTKRMGICAAMNHSRDGWSTETPSEWVPIYTPTCWMPLPAAPEPSK